MIVRMAKVELVGPRERLEDVLSLVRDVGVFHVEPALGGFVDKELADHVRSFAPDEKTMAERMFLEDLHLRIDELFALLPKEKVRRSYLEPLSVIDVIAQMLPRHLDYVKATREQRDSLGKEREELDRYAGVLAQLRPLMEKVGPTRNLEFIGLTIRDPGMEGRLRETISRLTDWRFELLTDTASDGSLVGLIAVERDAAGRVRSALSDEQVPELTYPPSFSGLPFAEKIAWLGRRTGEVNTEIAELDAALHRFVRRWVPAYERVREWVDDRLSLLVSTTHAFETRFCFFINGWMPARDVAPLREQLVERFADKVAVIEQQIVEEDLERVPIILQNPPYFRPFEVFTRLLPLPSYTSYDPTPFIGVFFPIFFGMILGDAGYGLVLAICAAVAVKRYRARPFIRDAAKILLVAALYTVFFGVLYGEFFGELPHTLFHLKPPVVDRRTAVVPMMYFALSVGAAHVLLGLVLGAVGAFKKKAGREATYRFVNIAVVLCVIGLVASVAVGAPLGFSRALVVAALVLVPVLLVTGGLLAPLEFLKNIGNVISYVRIMAIGLTSVLLAFVANRLAGATGNLALGILVAGFLHMLNIILGVFAPTIHSLRLHYVEFFGKFIEHGGRRFDPLRKRSESKERGEKEIGEREIRERG